MASNVFINKNAGPAAARIAGEHPAMDEAAGRVMRSIRRQAESHAATHAFINSLAIHKVPSQQPSLVGFVQDRVVTTTDPGALSIEYGRLYRYKNARRVRYEPGQYPMTRGMQATR